jgi:hypothetical protein
MTKGKKVAVIIAGIFATLAVVAAVYLFLPTAPKTIEGAWVSEDGLIVYMYQGGTARQFLEATYGKNSVPDQTFKYSVTDNVMRISEGKESSGKTVSLPPITLTMKFSNGNRMVTMYDGDLRVSSVYRVGGPEAKLLHLSNNWFK